MIVRLMRRYGRLMLAPAVLLGASALLTSCRTDDLCYTHPHGASVHVVYDWSRGGEAVPEGMRVWFYPQDVDGLTAQLRDLPGRDGGRVANLVEGRYHVVSHNNDTELILYTGREQHAEHTATTRDADILEPMSRAFALSSAGLRGDGDERVAAAPDELWLASAADIEVRDSATIVLAPRQVHCHYTYEFRNVGDTRGISRVSASISGMSAGVRMADGSHTGDVCTHPVEAHVDQAAGRIYGDFCTFGYPDGSEAPHRMGLYVVMTDGQKFKYTEGVYLDVTDQVRGTADPRNVHIVIDGLELPRPVTGGGFDPSVSDWDEEDHDIDI